MSTATRPASPVSARRLARRDLVLFLGLVAALSAPFEVAIARTGALADTGGVLLVAPLMGMPALSSVVVRLVTRQGFADVSFRRPRRRPGGGAPYLLLPVVVGLPAYAVALGLGVVRLDPPPLGGWVALVGVVLVVNVVVSSGEEIGWRGFMVTRVVDAGLPAPLLLSGVIWGLWHLPLVLWGGFVVDGPAPWVSAGLLLVLTASLGYLLARLRLESGSVWPPIALHVVWNVLFQAVFELAVHGGHEGLWLGEAGVLPAAAVTVVAVLLGPAGPSRLSTARVAP